VEINQFVGSSSLIRSSLSHFHSPKSGKIRSQSNFWLFLFKVSLLRNHRLV